MSDSTPAGTVREPLRIGMAAYGDITYDSRVQREAATLGAAGHHVVLACLPGQRALDWCAPNVRVLPVLPRRSRVLPGTESPYRRRAGVRRPGVILERLRWVGGYYANMMAWGARAASAVGHADAWHLHDFPALLAIARHVDRAIPIVYDSHEIYLDTGSSARLPVAVRALLRVGEGRLARRAAAVITVNPGVARILEERYRLSSVVIVRNCPPRRSGRPSDRIRVATGIPGGEPILLFHGTLTTNRGIERLVEALGAPGLERLHLVCLGNGPLAPALRSRAADPRLGGRLHVLDAVAPAELLEWVSSADLGAVLQQPADLNYVLSTPNKLYETIAAGIPVLASDLPEIRRIVAADPEAPLGILCDPTSDEAIEGALRSLVAAPETLEELRQHCRRAAEQRWNWETESQELLDIYERIAAGSVARAGRPGPAPDAT